MSEPEDKFTPIDGHEYLVTDQCLYMQDPPEGYNPQDPQRAPHIVQLVDIDTGTIVNLKSGSIIKIIDAKE